jgi:8-oxo-dGTP pyrophosphatase MutT (NUDIX family)
MNGHVSGRVSAVRAVVMHGDRYLLAQHHNYLPETIGKWGLPGGRIELKDADLHAALRRELFEEFGMTVDIVGFIAMYTYRDRAHHVYLAHPHSIEFTVDQSEILGMAWLTLPEVKEWHERGLLHTGFELPAIRSSLTRFGNALNGANSGNGALNGTTG